MTFASSGTWCVTKLIRVREFASHAAALTYYAARIADVMPLDLRDDGTKPVTSVEQAEAVYRYIYTENDANKKKAPLMTIAEYSEKEKEVGVRALEVEFLPGMCHIQHAKNPNKKQRAFLKRQKVQNAAALGGRGGVGGGGKRKRRGGGLAKRVHSQVTLELLLAHNLITTGEGRLRIRSGQGRASTHESVTAALHVDAGSTLTIRCGGTVFKSLNGFYLYRGQPMVESNKKSKGNAWVMVDYITPAADEKAASKGNGSAAAASANVAPPRVHRLDDLRQQLENSLFRDHEKEKEAMQAAIARKNGGDDHNGTVATAAPRSTPASTSKILPG